MATKDDVIKQFDLVCGTKIMAALLKAQQAITPVVKDATNPHFKSKYATLTAVLDACLGPLHGAGVVPIQEPTPQGLRTTLVHAQSGEYISSLVPIPAQDNPQKYGSWLTYAKRYALVSMLCIPQEDDDGNAAAAKDSKPTAAKRVADRKRIEAKIDAMTLEALYESKDAFEETIHGTVDADALRQYREKRIRQLANDH